MKNAAKRSHRCLFADDFLLQVHDVHGMLHDGARYQRVNKIAVQDIPCDYKDNIRSETGMPRIITD